MRYDDMGRELPDDTPVEMPVGFKRPKPLAQLVQELVRTELSKQAAAEGQESWDEANDFDIEDEDFILSPHELLDDEQEFRSAESELLDRAGKDLDNEKAAITQRKQESKDGRSGEGKGSGKESSADVERGGVGDGKSGVDRDGKERSAAGG